MDGIHQEEVVSEIQDRVVNAACLAEVIYEAAYTKNANVSSIGASCAVLHEYLVGLWNLVSEQLNE